MYDTKGCEQYPQSCITSAMSLTQFMYTSKAYYYNKIIWQKEDEYFYQIF